MRTNYSVNEVPILEASWRLHLEAENKSPKTIKAYVAATTQLTEFLAAAGMPTAVERITREHIEAFLVQ